VDKIKTNRVLQRLLLNFASEEEAKEDADIWFM